MSCTRCNSPNMHQPSTLLGSLTTSASSKSKASSSFPSSMSFFASLRGAVEVALLAVIAMGAMVWNKDCDDRELWVPSCPTREAHFLTISFNCCSWFLISLFVVSACFESCVSWVTSSATLAAETDPSDVVVLLGLVMSTFLPSGSTTALRANFQSPFTTFSSRTRNSDFAHFVFSRNFAMQAFAWPRSCGLVATVCVTAPITLTKRGIPPPFIWPPI
mmetsp:Transcript_93062/g.249095  ORF Transcript_93062/g.249095 Transcript_93062/m.249095 type:complete len:218 (+) Transcript_93062:829-1482(+)